ncbi:2-hydroxychromene-2-carboxylate isomerase [Blastochloris sulfoviridis]|uniref:2-hydroxychromene-2-carboxylate isomerase n=1 Tax=Blastochloris sulfoviridis TaxID=50712 RepID=A0A5M6HN58_9HYPH|nr:2-hydroxychromene-2-carboxylate isomerase [Blastochloris sulfoviridis]KAA5597227.1 2-hydroxychromene-2-carboxylate isomerase [Blastochloris sulfoviridis]
MPDTVEYFFSLVSPWAYLGHGHLLDIADRYRVRLVYRPVHLGPVFEATGGLPLAKRHPVRQRYRLVELQRWRLKRGVPLNLQPTHWPFDVGLADRLVIAADAADADTGALVQRLFEGVWAREENLADPATLEAIARKFGLDGAALVEEAQTEAVNAAYAENGRRALDLDVFGSPSYVRGGEVFWGQDRLDLLADALAAGRRPFAPA